jgi:hypothetical protein
LLALHEEYKMIKRIYIKRFLKYVLPVCALCVLGFVGVASHNVMGDSLSYQFSKNNAQFVRYTGKNQKGQPFELVSKSGRELSSEAILFNSIDGSIELSPQESVKLAADCGTYNKINRSIRLDGNVILHHSSGLVLKTSQADVDVHSGSATNTVPIEGCDTNAHIKAGSFRMEEHGTQIVFLGEPELTLQMRS